MLLITSAIFHLLAFNYRSLKAFFGIYFAIVCNLVLPLSLIINMKYLTKWSMAVWWYDIFLEGPIRGMLVKNKMNEMCYKYIYGAQEINLTV